MITNNQKIKSRKIEPKTSAERVSLYRSRLFSQIGFKRVEVYLAAGIRIRLKELAQKYEMPQGDFIREMILKQLESWK